MTIPSDIEVGELQMEIAQLRTKLQDRDDVIQHYQSQKQLVINLVTKHGMCQGAEGKQWVIDQAMRILLAQAYGQWRLNYEQATDETGDLYPLWDDGIPPP